MSDWPTVLLQEVSTEIVSGIACGKANVIADGTRHLRPFNVTSDGRLSVDDTLRIPESLIPDGRLGFQVGDILFNNTNSIDLVGKSAVFSTPLEATFSNHMTRIRVNKAEANPRYIHAFLRHLYQQRFFEGQATRWVGQAAFGTRQIKSVKIPLPPLDEQRRIVALLDRAEAIRRRADTAREAARALIPALFTKTFGDPATNPKGWEVVKLGELGSLDRGRSRHRPRNAAELYGGPYPFVQTGDVASSQGRITSFSQTYSEIGLAQSRIWPAGTLCITIAANIGKTGILAFDACFPDSVVGFTAGPEVRVEFVQAVLDSMQGEIEQSAPQAAQKNINLRILRELEIAVPPLPLQTAFAAQARRIEAMASTLDAATSRAEAMAAALSARLFG